MSATMPSELEETPDRRGAYPRLGEDQINALAELGCTGLRFKAPVHLGDTLYDGKPPVRFPVGQKNVF